MALIEGVSTIVTSISMRQQYKMMEEMQKAEMEKMQAVMRKGGPNPWAVDYDETLAKAQAPPQSEALMDKAKSFSF